MTRKKLLLVSVVAVVTLIVGAIFALTASNRLVWFFRVPDVRITANGVTTRGYIHRSAADATYYVTQIASNGQKVTYRVGPITANRETTAAVCSEWNAPDLPVFFVSRFEPPCWAVKQTAQDERSTRPVVKVITTSHRLEFTNTTGTTVTVVWQ